MQQYWFCTDHKVKLQTYINRYSSNPYFSVSKKNIEGSLNNAIAVKKITPDALPRSIELANKFFELNPTAEELDCVGTFCNRCNKIYSSPRYITTNQHGDLDVDFYDYWWIFRVPVSEKPQNSRGNYLLFYFQYLLFAYILNYTLLLEMRIFNRYIKIGLFVFFPIALVIGIYYYAGRGLIL